MGSIKRKVVVILRVHSMVENNRQEKIYGKVYERRDSKNCKRGKCTVY